MVKCPRCGMDAQKVTKEWDYATFHVKKFDCEKCGKGFMAYYKGNQFSHTIPKIK